MVTMIRSNHRANASQAVILATAWAVGMGIWVAGMASLAVFF